MMILLDGSANKVEGLGHGVEQLVTPRSRHLPGNVFAVDNSAFTNFDEKAFLKLLLKLRLAGDKPLWVACPDVVGEADATLKNYYGWYFEISHYYGFKTAYVLQDGQGQLKQKYFRKVPWDKMECLFIGGSTEYKLGPEVRYYVAEAKRRGKWVHMGRVNSVKRMTYARQIGCDSIDGSGLSRFTDTKMPRMLRALNGWWQQDLIDSLPGC